MSVAANWIECVHALLTFSFKVFKFFTPLVQDNDNETGYILHCADGRCLIDIMTQGSESLRMLL